jgi:hypothetical protein
MQQVDPPNAQADQLAPAQATVGGHHDQRPIARVDGVRQGGDLGHGGKAHLWRPLLAGALDRAGVARQIAGLHGRAEDARPARPVGDRVEGLAHARAGRVAEAGRALDRFERLGDPFEVARTRERLASVAPAPEARSLLETALATYERLACAPRGRAARARLGALA